MCHQRCSRTLLADQYMAQLLTWYSKVPSALRFLFMEGAASKENSSTSCRSTWCLHKRGGEGHSLCCFQCLFEAASTMVLHLLLHR